VTKRAMCCPAACLGNAGNTYWLQNMEQLNVKCGFPPIPNAAGAPSLGPGPAPVATATTTTTTSSAGAASPSSGGLVTSSGNAAAGAPPYVATPAGTPVAGPVTQSTGAGTSCNGLLHAEVVSHKVISEHCWSGHVFVVQP